MVLARCQLVELGKSSQLVLERQLVELSKSSQLVLERQARTPRHQSAAARSLLCTLHSQIGPNLPNYLRAPLSLLSLL